VDDGPIVRIDRKHPAFAGHFPGNPLVPGALLLCEAARAVDTRFGVRVRRVERAKFPAMLRPDVACAVELTETGGAFRVTCADEERTYLTAIVAAESSVAPDSSRAPQPDAGGALANMAQPAGDAPAVPFEEVATLLPHGGDMVLLDGVERWSETEIVCSTGSHLRAHNPLRHAHGLSTFCAIEYAAQAMALHGALMADKSPQSGLLVSVRDFVPYVDRLDDLGASLRVAAKEVRRDRRGGIYTFEMSAAGRKVATGQVGAILTTSRT
jgi:predicted hotdog family 3-hydroxylacyl-ACP dehydratase